jgi:hypothetical protein
LPFLVSAFLAGPAIFHVLPVASFPYTGELYHRTVPFLVWLHITPILPLHSTANPLPHQRIPTPFS